MLRPAAVLPLFLWLVIVFFTTHLFVHAEEPRLLGFQGKEPSVLPKWVDRRDVQSLRSAAEQGDHLAQMTLGWRFARGLSVPVNPAEAKRLLTIAASTGDPRAEFLRARLILTISSDPIELKEAVETLKRGSARGFGPAAMALWLLPWNSPLGVISQTERGSYIKVAAKAGVPYAMFLLHTAAQTGNDPSITKKNRKVADEWFTRLSEKLKAAPEEFEDEDLSFCVELLTNPLIPFAKELREEERILRLLRIACELGDLRAMTLCYQFFAWRTSVFRLSQHL